MTKGEIAAKLREAARLMNETGLHWVQGHYTALVAVDDHTEAAYCSLGAIRSVTNTYLDETSEESAEIALALAEVLPPSLAEDRPHSWEPGTPEWAYDRIVEWNDAEERTWEEVAAKFEEAATKVEVA